MRGALGEMQQKRSVVLCRLLHLDQFPERMHTLAQGVEEELAEKVGAIKLAHDIVLAANDTTTLLCIRILSQDQIGTILRDRACFLESLESQGPNEFQSVLGVLGDVDSSAGLSKSLWRTQRGARPDSVFFSKA